jgi:endonuclease YncB( thermonuclease family)
VNAEIVRTGHGRSYRKYKAARLDQFNALEAEAKAQGLGLWEADAEAAWEAAQ